MPTCSTSTTPRRRRKSALLARGRIVFAQRLAERFALRLDRVRALARRGGAVAFNRLKEVRARSLKIVSERGSFRRGDAGRRRSRLRGKIREGAVAGRLRRVDASGDRRRDRLAFRPVFIFYKAGRREALQPAGTACRRNGGKDEDGNFCTHGAATL